MELMRSYLIYLQFSTGKGGFSTEKGKFSTITLIIVEQKTIGTSCKYFGFLQLFSAESPKVAKFQLLNPELATTERG